MVNFPPQTETPLTRRILGAVLVFLLLMCCKPAATPTPRRNPLVGRWQCVKVISRFRDGAETTENKFPYRLVRSFTEDGIYEVLKDGDEHPVRIKGTFAIIDDGHFTQTIAEYEHPEFIGYTSKLEYRTNDDGLVIGSVPDYLEGAVPNPPIHVEAYFKPLK